jgi:hypothetical protein
MREVVMRLTKTGWVLGSGRWRSLGMGAAVLAAVGVVGTVPAAVASASPQQALNWTEQSPAASPPARSFASMAYDSANGTVVLFGGSTSARGSVGSSLGDTWTWNGTTWTEQSPAVSPPARWAASMAYDAATKTVMLFGGVDSKNDTWTWNGTTWTEQHPFPSPTTRWSASMAYDPATRSVVLFGGGTDSCLFNATWTWNGTKWTEHDPATSPGPRWQAAMADDAATGTVMLFGGVTNTTGCKGPYRLLQDTWTWG